jgi:16S rRNA (uracil1498-N3)-methyltransferase
MDQVFAEDENFADGLVKIEGGEYRHLKNVLRKKLGDEIRICRRSGGAYICLIEEMTEEAIFARIQDMEDSYAELSSRIVLFQGLPKGDKMEWIIQKAVELGASEIVPVAMKNCVVKLDEKRAAKKVSRWQNIAEAAAKQSKRSLLPKVHEILPFSAALDYAKELDRLFVPYEHARGMQETKEVLSQLQKGESAGIFIGPEGGYDPKEIQQAEKVGKIISLGGRILRTETAGLTALSILMYHIELL